MATWTPEEQQERKQLREDLWNLMAEKNLASVHTAQQRLSDWLQKHPDDRAMWEAGEPLAMLEDALLIVKREGELVEAK